MISRNEPSADTVPDALLLNFIYICMYITLHIRFFRHPCVVWCQLLVTASNTMISAVYNFATASSAAVVVIAAAAAPKCITMQCLQQ